MTVGELSDRIEIQDLLVRYARAIDTKDWDLLDTCFTPDAHVDYTSSGGIAGRYPEVTSVSLHSLPILDTPVYELTAAGRKILVDAAQGRQLSPLAPGLIRQLARTYYAGSGQLSAMQLLEHAVPMEVRGRAAPLWRADFDDWLQTTLYLHPDTGALVARRHRVWRWYDFLWALHIMDYSERETPTGVIPRVATVLGAVTVLSGVWLLYFSFRRPASTHA